MRNEVFLPRAVLKMGLKGQQEVNHSRDVNFLKCSCLSIKFSEFIYTLQYY